MKEKSISFGALEIFLPHNSLLIASFEKKNL